MRRTCLFTLAAITLAACEPVDLDECCGGSWGQATGVPAGAPAAATVRTPRATAPAEDTPVTAVDYCSPGSAYPEPRDGRVLPATCPTGTIAEQVSEPPLALQSGRNARDITFLEWQERDLQNEIARLSPDDSRRATLEADLSHLRFRLSTLRSGRPSFGGY